MRLMVSWNPGPLWGNTQTIVSPAAGPFACRGRTRRQHIGAGIASVAEDLVMRTEHVQVHAVDSWTSKRCH